MRANVAVDDLVGGFSSSETLLELRHNLCEARAQIASVSQIPFSLSTYCEAKCKDEVTKHLSTIQTHFDKLRSNKYFETVANRYQAILIVQFFDHLKAKKTRRYSLAEMFTIIVFQDWVRRDLKGKTEREKKAVMQRKWKSEVHGFRFWLQLSDEYGCGILAIIPESFKNEQ